MYFFLMSISCGSHPAVHPTHVQKAQQNLSGGHDFSPKGAQEALAKNLALSAKKVDAILS